MPVGRLHIIRVGRDAGTQRLGYLFAHAHIRQVLRGVHRCVRRRTVFRGEDHAAGIGQHHELPQLGKCLNRAIQSLAGKNDRGGIMLIRHAADHDAARIGVPFGQPDKRILVSGETQIQAMGRSGITGQLLAGRGIENKGGLRLIPAFARRVILC